jgi:SAM-dependent methyltransferase
MTPPDCHEPAFWDERYLAGRTPWDAGRVPVQFAAWLARTAVAGRAFVPGCGHGHEVAALAAAGWPVVGLDFSAAAVARSAALVAAHPTAVVHHADLFAPDLDLGPFAVVYERTVLCALPPARHAAYAARLAGVLVPGGLLAGYFFHGPEDEPPPYPLSPDALAALLGPHFRLLEDAPVPDSLPLYAGKERWQIWQRR